MLATTIIVSIISIILLALAHGLHSEGQEGGGCLSFVFFFIAAGIVIWSTLGLNGGHSVTRLFFSNQKTLKQVVRVSDGQGQGHIVAMDLDDGSLRFIKLVPNDQITTSSELIRLSGNILVDIKSATSSTTIPAEKP
jgi:hypothetical protein